jgi:hypothetical protein
MVESQNMEVFRQQWKNLGRTIWLFLYYYSLQGTEALDLPWGAGLFYGETCPCSDLKAAKALRCSVRTVARYRKHLAKLGYIEQKRTACGYLIKIPSQPPPSVGEAE